jgi:hypothetical protein
MVNIPLGLNASSERQEVIDWLIAHNYPALPVAPAQSRWKYHKVIQAHPEQGVWSYCPLEPLTLQPIPLYTGKNPSYLDRYGCPHLVNHRQYQNRLPYNRELELWFANPSNGVGTLGGWNNTVWLDFDVKQFPSQQECDAAVLKILEGLERLKAGTLKDRSISNSGSASELVEENAPTCQERREALASPHSQSLGVSTSEAVATQGASVAPKELAQMSAITMPGAPPANLLTPTLFTSQALPYQTLIERTHSGGWRIAVKVNQKPDFTNFSLTPGGSHVGEALYSGRFTVLAPTVGASGNPYRSISRTEPVEVEFLESIGIYSTKGELGIKDSHSPLPIPGNIPLELLGTETATQILKGDCPTGDRSEALATAIQEWYGWQNWTHNNGIHISSDATTLAHHAGSLLGLDSDRINRILKTIDLQECQPAALYRGGEESCWKKIHRLDKATFEAKCPTHIKEVITAEWGLGSGNGGGSGGGRRGGIAGGDGGNGSEGDNHSSHSRVVKLPNTLPIDTETIRRQIKDILIQDLPPSELQTAKIRIRTDNPGVSEREISRLFETLERELELEESREHRRQEVDGLLKLGDQSLNLREFLPAELAEPLEELARGLNIRPEVCLTFLLVATSSLHKTTTELVIHKGQSFSVPPTIFAGLVSESGQKKSPILKAIIKKPMAVLQREKREAFQEALLKYEKDIAEWDKCKPEERSSKFPQGKPNKPQQQLYYFTNATGEGLLYQFQAHPDKALLALVDELVGLFASQNKYSGGRGSDRQDILSAFDGTGATVLRAAGTKADIDGLLLSICGTIQPEVLKQLMRDCSDPDGQWARFLFVNQPLAAATLADDLGGGVDLTGRLLDYYRAIDRLPATEYRLSWEAFKRYQPVYNQLERLRVSHPNPGMRAVYSKMEGYIGRLALNLHVLHELAAGKTLPAEEISLSILERAIALAKFYIGQVKLIHANCAAGSGDMAPQLAKIVELSKRMDATTGDSWIKAKVVQSGYDSRHRPRPDEIRSWFRELEALGIGSTRGTGIRLEYSWKLPDVPFDEFDPSPPEKVEKSGEKWITYPPTETTQNQGLLEKVEKVDNPTHLIDEKAEGIRIEDEKILSVTPQGNSTSRHISESLHPSFQSIDSEPLRTQSQEGGASSSKGTEVHRSEVEEVFLESSLLSVSRISSPALRVPKVVSQTKNSQRITHSTYPLSSCDDDMASLEAVDTISTFAPPVESVSTFEDCAEPPGKILHLKATQPMVNGEEHIQDGIVLRVSRENQCKEPMDSRDAAVEVEGKVILWVTAPSQNFSSSPKYTRVLVTVEESLSSQGFKETELLALVTTVGILRTGSFLVEWSNDSPNPPAGAKQLGGQNLADSKELDVEPPALAPDAEVDRFQVGVKRWREAKLPGRDSMVRQPHSYSVGDCVHWANCPSHCEQFAPFEITAIDGDYAKLDLFEKPVLLAELHPIQFHNGSSG